jgi:hypothetical protein
MSSGSGILMSVEMCIYIIEFQTLVRISITQRDTKKKDGDVECLRQDG